MIHGTRETPYTWPPGTGITRSIIDGIHVEWSGTLPTVAEVRAVHPRDIPTPQKRQEDARKVADARLAEAGGDADPVWAAIKELHRQVAALDARLAAREDARVR